MHRLIYTVLHVAVYYLSLAILFAKLPAIAISNKNCVIKYEYLETARYFPIASSSTMSGVSRPRMVKSSCNLDEIFKTGKNPKFKIIDDPDNRMKMASNFRFGSRDASRLKLLRPLNRVRLCRKGFVGCCAGKREKLCFIKLIVTTETSDYFEIEFLIKDRNDYAPVFPKAEVNIEFTEELTTVRARLPVATDRDSLENGVKNYVIEPASLRSVFRVEKVRSHIGESADLNNRNVPITECWLSLIPAQKLDRERKQSYRLRVVALDHGGKSAVLSVNIKVQDINDNTPEISKNRLVCHVSETRLVNTRDNRNDPEICQIVAKDSDAGLNARLNYRLGSTPYSRYFHLNAENGKVLLRQRLDFETLYAINRNRNNMNEDSDTDSDASKLELQLQLPIVVSDLAEPVNLRKSARATLIINVQDENDERPVIHVGFTHTHKGNEIFIHEEDNRKRYASSITLPKMLALVSVTDRDYGANGKFACKLFVNKKPPSYRRTNRGTFNNEVENEDNESAAALFQLNIQKKTKHTIKYKLDQIRALDREEAELHRLIIQCREYVSPFKRVEDTTARNADDFTQYKIIVRVLDVNDNYPKIIESTSNGGFVPMDTSREKQISLFETNSLLFTAGSRKKLPHFQSFRRERRKLIYRFNISDADVGKNGQIFCDLGNIKAILRDGTAKKLELSSSSLSSRAGRSGNLNDDDNGDNLPLFYIKTHRNHVQMGHQKVRMRQFCELYAKPAEALDREKFSSFDMKLVVNDLAKTLDQRHTTTLSLNIRLLDLNDNAPQCKNSKDDSQNLSFEVDEHFGTIEKSDAVEIGTIAGVDADVTPSIFYFQMKRPNRHFQINKSDGRILATRILDREQQAVFKFDILLSDGPSAHKKFRQLTTECKVTVRLLDLNDNAPKFTKPSRQNTSINVNHNLNYIKRKILTKIEATDSDSDLNGKVAFSVAKSIRIDSSSSSSPIASSSSLSSSSGSNTTQKTAAQSGAFVWPMIHFEMDVENNLIFLPSSASSSSSVASHHAYQRRRRPAQQQPITYWVQILAQDHGGDVNSEPLSSRMGIFVVFQPPGRMPVNTGGGGGNGGASSFWGRNSYTGGAADKHNDYYRDDRQRQQQQSFFDDGRAGGANGDIHRLAGRGGAKSQTDPDSADSVGGGNELTSKRRNFFMIVCLIVVISLLLLLLLIIILYVKCRPMPAPPPPPLHSLQDVPPQSEELCATLSGGLSDEFATRAITSGKGHSSVLNNHARVVYPVTHLHHHTTTTTAGNNNKSLKPSSNHLHQHGNNLYMMAGTPPSQMAASNTLKSASGVSGVSAAMMMHSRTPPHNGGDSPPLLCMGGGAEELHHNQQHNQQRYRTLLVSSQSPLLQDISPPYMSVAATASANTNDASSAGSAGFFPLPCSTSAAMETTQQQHHLSNDNVSKTANYNSGRTADEGKHVDLLRHQRLLHDNGSTAAECQLNQLSMENLYHGLNQMGGRPAHTQTIIGVQSSATKDTKSSFGDNNKPAATNVSRFASSFV